MSFLDQLSARVNQGFNQVTSQTKDFTEQVKIENEIKNLEKAAQANYEELGRAMYNASRHPSGSWLLWEMFLLQKVLLLGRPLLGRLFPGKMLLLGRPLLGRLRIMR